MQGHPMTLTLTRQCPMSNASELFSYATICLSFNWTEPLFYQVHKHTQTHTDTHTDGHEYSIVAVDKPHL